MTANLLKTLIAKLLSSKFVKESHTRKMHDSIKKVGSVLLCLDGISLDSKHILLSRVVIHPYISVSIRICTCLLLISVYAGVPVACAPTAEAILHSGSQGV